MRPVLFLLFLFWSFLSFGQSDALAKEYFEKSQFEKAALAYEELLKSTPNQYQYFNNLTICYQELKQFDKADKLIEQWYQRLKQPNLLVEKGYNYQLEGKTQKAENCYTQALDVLKQNPLYASGIAYAFEQKNLLQKALDVYEFTEKQNSNQKFDFQKARIYGQMGDLQRMVDSFLDYAYTNPNTTLSVQMQFQRFMDDDASDVFIPILQKSLLSRTQKNQEIYWNEFLSWFFIQQKQYGKALVQEKAIYKRTSNNLNSIIGLMRLALGEEEYALVQEIATFVSENTSDYDTLIYIQTMLMEVQTLLAKPSEYPKITSDFQNLIQKFGNGASTVNLQILQAHFVGFQLGNPSAARKILEQLLSLDLNLFNQAEVKLKLADLFLYEEKFNQALIYYSQIETELKNQEIGQLASLKTAQTSYYKGDFDWALKQLGVLKTSFSQLIANDALELYLLITDNKANDSTYAALKEFATADFLMYQNKKQKALNTFRNILENHKGEAIEAATLYRIGKLSEELQDHATALTSFTAIINRFPESIYVDKSLFFAAQTYEILKDPTRAKELYEVLVFKHQDSILYIEAQKRYRLLRGDTI